MKAVQEIVEETAKINELTEDIDPSYKIAFYDMLFDVNNNPVMSEETRKEIQSTGDVLIEKLNNMIYEVGKPYLQEVELMDKNPQVKYLYLDLKESRRKLFKALKKID